MSAGEVMGARTGDGKPVRAGGDRESCTFGCRAGKIE